ncbi:hypothetical protein I6A60_32220 [Frankia sp. AgB1.9]|uniref:hypothetical protein n=1 Tax=unclassified Frankia TaxID=2632575 RepID=UPI0019322413|nr:MULTISPECIES: hypothetical protein [unclassified Frankia]MBL7552491.1 hypothetical protein [Frankia sp. AgB1.9]
MINWLASGVLPVGEARLTVQISPEEAAGRIVDDPRIAIDSELLDEVEVSRAVTAIGRQFDELARLFSAALEGALDGTQTISADRFQGLAEIVRTPTSEAWQLGEWMAAVGSGAHPLSARE